MNQLDLQALLADTRERMPASPPYVPEGLPRNWKAVQSRKKGNSRGPSCTFCLDIHQVHKIN
jgi:hypothetical protein